MKKLVLIILSVMAFAGTSVAQDIWASGYFYTTSNNNNVMQAGVYRNGTKVYSTSFANGYHGNSTDVDVYNGDVYWVSNCYNSSDQFHYGAVKKNNSLYWDPNSGDGSHIYDLYRTSNGTLFAAGCVNVDGVRRAAMWRNNEGPTPVRTYGDAGKVSEAFGLVLVGSSGNVHVCGYQYTNSSTYHGVIWCGGSVTHAFDNGTKLYAITYDAYSGYLYTVGSAVESGSIKLKVWKTNPSDGTTNEVWELSSSMSSSWVSERFSIYIDDALDVYVNGMDGSSEKVWKNGHVLYTQGSFLTSVVANTNGVYYSGADTYGTIWKDGSVLYAATSNNQCIRYTNLFIANPPCNNSEVRSLPFNETFENGSTSWPCWTTIDQDNNNGSVLSYWMRVGTRFVTIPNGDYCARHGGNNSNSQTGWLITPRLFLQPGQAETLLTFKSWTGTSLPLKVYVYYGSSAPTATSDWHEVWSGTYNDSWTMHTIDLSAYQGYAVYIGFKYTGSVNSSWLIDDVNVTESFTPCAATNAPYSYSFEQGFGNCWTAYDADMSGDRMCWRAYSSGGETTLWHYYGSPAQTGWLYSPRVTLPAGNFNYTLSYKTRNSGTNGTGESHTVWIALDKTGAYVPADYTLIYTEPDYPQYVTTRTIDLTQYKGHTVSIAFKYMGTNAHGWNIDDFAITKEVANYTITVNANNNAWGTVSGGGDYAPGETCVLHANANPGYVFQSWKKGGTVVSTNPNYSFTVNESATYTAYFGEAPVVYYTITTNVTPAGSGTVTGGGTHASGSSITLEAVNNPGWTFAHWQDNNTQNPRTITVTGDATYTATFTQNNYTITTNVTPAGAGTVTGGGTYHYGDNVTLTATAGSGYEFAGWNDGNSDNPRLITVTGNATYTATFSEVGTTYFTVTASVNPEGAGTVSGTGTFPAGASTQLIATANQGYTFNRWQDGSTTNPRTVTVNNDMDFTAYFTQNQYIITVVADPSNAGTVGGGGAYYYGNYATLTATAYSGYQFQGWSDGSTENPHQVMVTDNATYTATFSVSGSTYYTVSAYVSPDGAGTVSGTGTFPAGTTTTLTATANEGYVFDHWNDGNTSPTRTVTVTNNMSFTAYFNSNQYTITVNASPAAGGTVSGGGSYAYGATATLTAMPNSGYSFMQWSDGNTSNPRYVTVTGNASYTALFMAAGGETYMLTVTSGNILMGQVSGSGVYPAGASVEIRAIPASYARFVKWNDGNTENPRTVVVNDNLEFIAEFAAAQQYTITVLSSNEEWGQVFGGGTFNEGTDIQISALANDGYVFTGWNDGNTQNPRTVRVERDATYTAQFAESSMTTYTLQLICNTSEGTVSGGGVYIGGTTATIQAFPNPGYVFTKWSDENTQNPRTITMNSDMTLVAFFATGVDENALANLKLYPNPAKESIRLLGIEANSQIEIYNSLGELVRVVSASENQEISVRDLASGLYMVRCGSVTLRFVKE